jgi:hypothetical protein
MSRSVCLWVPVWLLMLGLWGCLCSPAPADDWMQWRGPDANGVAVGESYPLKWTAEEGVLWKAALPGLGASTPIIFDDHILVTGGHDAIARPAAAIRHP